MAADTTVAHQEKSGQSGHLPQQGKATGTGAVQMSATDARQGVRIGMWRVLAVSLVAAILAMVAAFYLAAN